MKKKYSWWHTKISKFDKKELFKSVSNNLFTQGKIVTKVEKKLEQVFQRPVILTQNGTSAILMALMSLDLKKTDEVLIGNFGWIASVQPAAILNLNIKLVDVGPDVPNLTLKNIKKNISKRTKVIIFMHFHGHSNNIVEISKFCKEKKIILIEDSCKAFMSKDKNNRLAGTNGSFGCFSTGMISLISNGYGGFLVVNNKKYEKKIRLIKDHGCIRKKELYPHLGLNFKTSDYASSLLINQIDHLDVKVAKLKKIYSMYSKITNNNLIILKYSKNEVPLCIDLYSQKIKQIKKIFIQKKIPYSNLHKPFHNAKFLNKLKDSNFKNSTNFYKNMMMLPCGPDQNLKIIKKTINVLNEFKQRNNL